MGVCGGVLGIVNASYLTYFWCVLGWRQPVANWMISIGLGETIAFYWWGNVWFQIPLWVLAAVLGIITGLCVSKRWFIASLSCALAFVFTPDLVLFVMSQENPITLFGWDVFIAAQCWNVPSVAIIVLLAFLSSRIVRNRRGPSALLPIAEGETSDQGVSSQ